MCWTEPTQVCDDGSACSTWWYKLAYRLALVGLLSATSIG